jgi:uncharacterized protein with NRDE domain
MCTLLLWKREHPRYPLIAAANRDEYLDRPSTAPQTLSVAPLVVGGRDEVAGGTWFAVNNAGIIVALTNRRGAGSHDPTRRSRGRLVAEIARSRSFAEAIDRVARVDAASYNPFVLFVADARDASAVHCGSDGMRIEAISDGVHAVTNWDLDALLPPKAARALSMARTIRPGRDDVADAIAPQMRALLSDHGDRRGSDVALCVHRAESAYGTRSSTIAFLGATPADTRLFHAEGPPCTATLEDLSALIRHETSEGSAKENGR